MKLATSTGDLCLEYLGRDDEAIEAIAATSFKHFNIELSEGRCAWHYGESEWNAYISRLQAALKKSGADGVQAHSFAFKLESEGCDYETIVEGARRDIRACDRLGIPDCVVHPMYRSDMNAREMYRFNRQFYLDILSGVKGTDVHVLIENSADSEQHSNLFATGRDMRDFLEYMDHPMMGACWDTSHGNLNHPPRNDQYANLTALGSKLRALHVADNFGVGHGHHHTFPLAGVINFDSILCALVDIGYQGVFNFEASYTLRQPKMAPMWRNEWKPPEGRTPETRLMSPSPALKLKAIELLYEIGKYMLDQYGLLGE